MMTSFKNSPSFKQNRSSLVTEIPPVAGAGGYVNNLQASGQHKGTCQKLNAYPTGGINAHRTWGISKTG